MREIVIEEEDEMIEMGFREEIEFIMGEEKEERRKMML